MDSVTLELRPPPVRDANTTPFRMAESGMEGSCHGQNLTASGFRIFKSKGLTEYDGLLPLFQPVKSCKKMGVSRFNGPLTRESY